MSTQAMTEIIVLPTAVPHGYLDGTVWYQK